MSNPQLYALDDAIDVIGAINQQASDGRRWSTDNTTPAFKAARSLEHRLRGATILLESMEKIRRLLWGDYSNPNAPLIDLEIELEAKQLIEKTLLRCTLTLNASQTPEALAFLLNGTRYRQPLDADRAQHLWIKSYDLESCLSMQSRGRTWGNPLKQYPPKRQVQLSTVTPSHTQDMVIVAAQASTSDCSVEDIPCAAKEQHGMSIAAIERHTDMLCPSQIRADSAADSNDSPNSTFAGQLGASGNSELPVTADCIRGIASFRQELLIKPAVAFLKSNPKASLREVQTHTLDLLLARCSSTDVTEHPVSFDGFNKSRQLVFLDRGKKVEQPCSELRKFLKRQSGLIWRLAHLPAPLI